MSISRKDFLNEKFSNFKIFIASKTPSDFIASPDIERFNAMTEEEVLTFAISHLLPHKNNIDFPTRKICEMFQIDFNEKSISLIIANYLELFIHLIP